MDYAQSHGAVLEKDAFHLPQPGLFADMDVGSGSVSLSDEFRGLSVAAQIAIIKDWQIGLEQERRLAVVTLFRQVTGSMGSLDLPRKIGHFRSVCSRIGIDCPSDIAILLQQV